MCNSLDVRMMPEYNGTKQDISGNKVHSLGGSLDFGVYPISTIFLVSTNP